MRLTHAAALVLCVSLTSHAQEADPRAKSLDVVPKWSGKKLEVAGTINMPDNTVLLLRLERETEKLFHHKVECRLYTQTSFGTEQTGLDVRRGKFTGGMAAPAPGIYRMVISYTHLAQIDEGVLKQLGANYGAWERTFLAVVFDKGTLHRQLADEQPVIADMVAELKRIAQMIDVQYQSPPKRRDFKAINRAIDALEKKAQELILVSAYTATVDVVIQCLAKMRGCSPEVPTLGHEPGTPEGEHAKEGFEDIPEGVNYTWQFDLVKAYIGRIPRVMMRERHIVPLRYAVAAWQSYLHLIRSADTSEVLLDRAKGMWEETVEAVEKNSKTIESELPDKRRWTKEDEMIAQWCTLALESLKPLDEFAAQRRSARAGSIEQQQALDEKGEKDAREKIDALLASIRRVPS